MKKNVLAVDFGASSGRVILGAFENGELRLEEIHRFPNIPLEREGHLYWDFPTLCREMLVGIKRAVASYDIDSVGIDTWGVDYGLLDEQEQLLGLPFHYRDSRTAGYGAQVLGRIGKEALYQETGNQLLEINTLFQLLAERDGARIRNAETLLFMPDLFGHFLTGQAQSEVTIASTSQLMNPVTAQWNWRLIEQLGLPKAIFPNIVQPGTLLGTIQAGHGVPELAVLTVASHDTASAVASVPAEHRFLFISCGTWSLVGTELSEPVLTAKAQNYNLTNEKGVNHTTRFLKNLTGLWLIQEVKREFAESGNDYSYAELEDLGSQAERLRTLIDTDAPEFVAPGRMIQRIQNYAAATGQPVPVSHGQVIRCVYESLAFKYKYTYLEIVDSVGYEFDSVNIVGGGANSPMLCQMVASATNLPVFAGPTEATAIGNINTQLMYHGALASLEEARVALRRSDSVKRYAPKLETNWDREFGRYQLLLESR